MTTERFLPDRPSPDHRAVAIGLGSNLGSRIECLRSAARWLDEGLLGGLRFSAVYETAPLHVVEQPDFLNACAAGWTRLAPHAVLDQLKAFEREAGRSPSARRYGPRELDLDILLYDAECVDTDRLTIPHPRLLERAFALIPLAEIAGAWVHPTNGGTIRDLAAAIDPAGIQATNLRIDPR